MQKGPHTPKGFRDIHPDLAKKRRRVINQIVEVLEESDFIPCETPTIEFAQTLKGKYGEEERLIYEFADRGGRNLALRFDLTVPLARYVANYNPKLPFRRYQIGQVFRGENPQHGRYREFTQFDFDTVGSSDVEEDAKIIACAIKGAKKIGLNNAVMLVNDRKSFSDVPPDFVIALDKLHKIGEEGVRKELEDKKYNKEKIDNFLVSYQSGKQTETIISLLKNLENFLEKDEVKNRIILDPSLARGLDYYTGAIFELKPDDNPASLSIGSGGRYDNLIGSFSGKTGLPAGRQVPAVGFSFGIDRLVEII